MVKDLKEKVLGGGGGEKKLLVGLAWNCAAELKLLVTALFLLCSLATLLQLLPSRFSSDIRFCLSSSTAVADNVTTNTSSSPPPPFRSAELLPSGVIKRSFKPAGAAAYSFILMSAYRGGPNSFAVIALSSKPLNFYGRPSYLCEYQNHNSSASVSVAGTRILPDWGYGRVYTVVVVNCTFSSPVGVLSGGRLLIHANSNGAGDRDLNTTDSIEALIEPPNSVHLSSFSSPPKYDYLYCGSSLYGNLSPQRVREWIAYHVRLFGGKSHFVIHDAGGVHPEVLEVLRPWMELGYVSLQDIRDQERFDGYYHNQFLIVNDCLHRYRFDTKWMFFFDVDEFIFVPGKKSLRSVMDSLKEYSQFTIEQMPMSNKLCLTEDYGKTPKKWGFEKLVYRDVKRGIRRDRKYAVQPREVFATGVHMSQNLQGKTTHRTDRHMKYFHYHGTIAERREPCRKLMNATGTMLEGTPYALDTSMRAVAPFVKRFELNTIGTRLQRTRQ
ncbi:hypothetical protein V2J09_021356 [Rumex salicifolius]